MPAKQRSLSLFTFGLIVASYAPASAQQPMGMFRGDAAHSGVYRGGGSTVVGLQWRVPTDGDVTSTPVVVGNVVYVGSDDGHLLALDRLTGQRRWTYDAGQPVSSSPAVAQSRVFIALRDGTLLALDAQTGKVTWRRTTGPLLPFPWGHESGDRYISSAVYDAGVVYFGAGDGAVYALDASTGRTKWTARTEGRIRGTPAIANGKLFVGSFDGRVYAFDLARGALRWRYETAGVELKSGDFGFDRRSIQASPAIADGIVVIGARDGFLYALDAASGALKWKFDHKVSWVNASAAVASGVVYVGSSDGHFLQAVDLATGAERWRASTGPAVVWSSAAITDKYVYYGDGAGRLHVADIATGKERATFRTGASIFSSPVIDGNLVIFGSSDGGVYAVRVDESTPVRRAVFFDSALVDVSQIPNSGDISRYFANRGYEVLNASGLAGFLESRVADRAPSVVVFAIDALPEQATIVAGSGKPLFRRYLEAGGKVVWSGLPPLIWPVAPGTKRQSLNEVRWDAPTKLLDVPHAAALFDARGARATAVGRRWGLPSHWRDAWSVDPKGVSEVLALDDWSLAASWVKNYGGPPGTGFVRVGTDDLLGMFLAAEFRPAQTR